MENDRKVFAMAMLYVLAIAVASKTSSGVKHRALAWEDKGDGKPKEREKVASSPPPISLPTPNASPTIQGHNSPSQPSQLLPNSNNSDSSSSKTVPSPGTENLNPGSSRQGDDNTSMNPPTKEEDKASEAPKKEGDNPVQSPRKEDRKAPQDPQDLEKSGDMSSVVPTKDNVAKGSPGILESESDRSKNESCETGNATSFTCKKGVLVACLVQSRNESTMFFLLVQNTGENDLNVYLKSPSNIKIDPNSLNLKKHSNGKVNLTEDASKGLIIILDSGEGECVLQTMTSSSSSYWHNIPQLPAYAAQFRLMHVAYFLFATIIVVGGTWACCKFGKREKRIDAQIPYQQLEMATHTLSTSAAVNEVPANSWDQSWDDDWDDEEAVVRIASKQPTENISSNGLSSRSANPSKDGWEIDWDD